ncbi:hypothetical protein EZY14_006350 [Kordia sp. TARA_039_SRF]|jgi:hypothetical protein|nr:hypothetical protein EZY14_006350 [Kordia sp. TARA_039_SRF]
MKKNQLKSLKLKKTSISHLNLSTIKGGLPTTKQSTVAPDPADLPTSPYWGYTNEASGCDHC